MYDDNDPYANREIRLYASIFLPPLGSYFYFFGIRNGHSTVERFALGRTE